MKDNNPTVNVRYGLSPDARQAFAKALGHIDVNSYPVFPSIPDMAYVPTTGDRLRWEEVPRGIFVIIERHFLAKVDGSLEIDLMIEVDGGDR